MSFNIYPDWTKRNGIYPQWLGPDAEPVPAEEPQKLYGGGDTGFQKVQGTRSYPDSGRIDHEKRKQRRRNMAIIEFVTQFTTEYL